MSKNLEESKSNLDFQTLNPRIPIIHTLNDEIVKIEYCAEMKELSLKVSSLDRPHLLSHLHKMLSK